jgi:hypothetical protein
VNWKHVKDTLVAVFGLPVGTEEYHEERRLRWTLNGKVPTVPTQLCDSIKNVRQAYLWQISPAFPQLLPSHYWVPDCSVYERGVATCHLTATFCKGTGLLGMDLDGGSRNLFQNTGWIFLSERWEQQLNVRQKTIHNTAGVRICCLPKNLQTVMAIRF